MRFCDGSGRLFLIDNFEGIGSDWFLIEEGSLWFSA